MVDEQRQQIEVQQQQLDDRQCDNLTNDLLIGSAHRASDRHLLINMRKTMQESTDSYLKQQISMRNLELLLQREDVLNIDEEDEV